MKSNVITLFLMGLFFILVGGGIVYACWPEVVITPGYTSNVGSAYDIEPTFETTGSEFGVFIGSFAALAGQIMMVIATIAVGVRIATRDAEDDEASAERRKAAVRAATKSAARDEEAVPAVT